MKKKSTSGGTLNFIYKSSIIRFHSKSKKFSFLIVSIFLLGCSTNSFSNILENNFSKSRLTTILQYSNPENDWTLIFQDSLVKVSYKNITCEGTSSIKLKIENLTNQDLSLTYKLSTSSQESKLISLFAMQALEGICSTEYQNTLLEPFSSETEKPIIQISHKLK
jgi:hypothetical protein